MCSDDRNGVTLPMKNYSRQEIKSVKCEMK